MEDIEILELYEKRSESAICETDAKYRKLCRKIIYGILNDNRDQEEIIEDTWMTLWNSIPPKKPNPFSAYVCRVAKNLALKKYEYNHAGKRKSNYELSLEELAECTGHGDPVEDNILKNELTEAIHSFLDHLSKEKRILFLRRYWFMDSIKEIAEDYQITEKNASMRLARIRKQLKKYLVQEGYIL